MATGHGLSVLTNSCVKLPLHPRTGLSSTSIERPQHYLRTADVGGPDFVETRDGIETLGTTDDGAAKTWTRSADGLAVQLSQLSDEEFYAKLQYLKNEQRKVLDTCERRYKEKLQVENLFATGSYNDTFFDADDVNFEVPATQPLSTPNQHYTEDLAEVTADRDPHLFSKPPTGKSPSKQGPLYSTQAPSVSKSIRNRPISAPIQNSMRRSRSLDENEFEHLHRQSTDQENGFENFDYRAVLSDKVSPDVSVKAKARIEDMWDDFSVEDYAPRERRHSSASQVVRDETPKPIPRTAEWRHRITIPEPFKMTVRESLKEKKRTSAQEELHKNRLEKEKEEELECQKKFKAQPVPAHIYLPLYDQIKEKSDARRRYVREYCKEMIKSQVKPFNFDKRETDKRSHRCQSASGVSLYRGDKTNHKFRASGVPDYIYDNTVNEKIKEEEAYRKIRIKLRAEEKLREANLPPSMEARQKMKEMKARERAMKTKNDKKSRTRRFHEVPDYDALYREFQKEVSRRKQLKNPTRMEPFNLETSRIESKQDRILREIEQDNERLKETRWPYQGTRGTPRGTPRSSLKRLSTSLDSIPSKSTAAADLRASATKQRMEQLTQRELQELEEEKRRRIREMRLRRTFQEQATLPDPPQPREKVQERLRRYKEDERQREEVYQRELEEMRMRVEKRPFLFEQQSRKSAKNAAERKYSATLRNVGLDEDFVKKHSSAAGSVRSEDYEDRYDDDFERE